MRCFNVKVERGADIDYVVGQGTLVVSFVRF